MINTWIRYFDRTYDQIRQQILDNLASRVPEMTDRTDNNLFVRLLSIWAGVAEMLGYYIDNAARESFSPTARRLSSMVTLAEQHDLRVRAFKAASTQVTFTLAAVVGDDVIIPAGSSIFTPEGVEFKTVQSSVIIGGQLAVTVDVKQLTQVLGVVLGVATGAARQEYVLSGQPAANAATAKVNNIAWALKETLATSVSTDEHYVMTVNREGQVIIRFGDGVNGKRPPASQQITVDYSTTLGALGNSVEANTITDSDALQETLPSYPFTVSNSAKATGGGAIDSVEQLRYLIPNSVRTRWSAVTAQDFIDIAQQAAGVIRAGIELKCTKQVLVFIVPDGGGIASSLLLSDTQAYIAARKIVTMQVEVYSAGEVRMLIRLRVRVLAGFSRAIVGAAVTAALTSYLSYLKQEISGRVNIGDIYQLIENVPGVDSSDLERFTPQPYARPLASGVPALSWTRTLKPAAAGEVLWKVVMTASNAFIVYRNNVFIGGYTAGQTVVTPELDFIISTNNYAINHSWEFRTYRYTGNLSLNEPSIPVAYAGDIALILEGGVA